MGWEFRCFFPTEFINSSPDFIAHLKTFGVVEKSKQNVEEIGKEDGRTDVYEYIEQAALSIGLKKRGSNSGLEVKLRDESSVNVEGLEKWSKFKVNTYLDVEKLLGNSDIALKSKLPQVFISKKRSSAFLRRLTLSPTVLIFDKLYIPEGKVTSWCSLSIEGGNCKQITQELHDSGLIELLSDCEHVVFGGYPSFVHHVLTENSV